MSYETYQVIWFGLWGLLWAVYFMLDGFDLGAGTLYPFLGKNDEDKRMIINTLGPVWDGNEVWLVTAGGATFAAFPTTYALMFSYLYTPLLIILFALIFRGVAFEFRGKNKSKIWKAGWDVAIFLGSFTPALLFGVAFGNIFAGLPIDAEGYHGNLFSLLNGYGIITGLLFVILFITHASLWISIKTTGDLSERAKNLSKKLWNFELVIAVIFLIYTYFATNLYNNYVDQPLWFIVPIITVLALVLIRVYINKSFVFAFFSSCVTILGVTFTGIIGLFPNLIPSSLDTAYSMTIYNTSSSHYTLSIMTIVVILFVPIVLLYQIWNYTVFRKPLTKEDLYDPESEAY